MTTATAHALMTAAEEAANGIDLDLIGSDMLQQHVGDVDVAFFMRTMQYVVEWRFAEKWPEFIKTMLRVVMSEEHEATEEGRSADPAAAVGNWLRAEIEAAAPGEEGLKLLEQLKHPDTWLATTVH